MRDNFTQKTKELLAKRVGLKCSNPSCGRATIGPNSVLDKTTSIGVAAHITAAAPGGPRFDPNLNQEERIEFSNGIWLCQTCSTLIDKDPDLHPVDLLRNWKAKAEDKAFQELYQEAKASMSEKKERPILEAELFWTGSSKRNDGLSYKNDEKFLSGSIPISEAIYWNRITWRYDLKIYNNSSMPCFNIRLYHKLATEKLEFADTFANVNNIPPLHYDTLACSKEILFEGTGREGYEMSRQKYPKLLDGIEILLEYMDESREQKFYTLMRIEDEEINNEFLTDKPDEFEEK